MSVSQQPHTPATLAEFALLDDLRRYGVTTALAADPRGIVQDFTPAPAKPVAKTAEEAIVEKAAESPSRSAPKAATRAVENQPKSGPAKQRKPTPADNKPARKNFAAERFVLEKTGAQPFTVVMTMEGGQLEPMNFNDPAEKTLWQNMMAAIDLDAEGDKAPSYLMITGETAIDGNLRESEEALLREALTEKITNLAADHRAVLAVGGRARRLLLPEGTSGRGKQGAGESLSLKKGCNCPLLTIYQLQAMLRQPTLKRQTWATLLKLQEALS